MNPHLWVLLSLSVALMHCHVEGQTVDATFQSVANDWRTTKLDEVGNRGRELLQSSAFSVTALRGVIGRCRDPGSTRVCPWRNNFIVYCSTWMYSLRELSREVCCCACRLYRPCLGVIYYVPRRKCTFLFEQRPNYVRAPGFVAWLKSSG